MTINLTDTIVTDEAAARAHLEAIRWPDGSRCAPLRFGAIGSTG